MEQSSSFPDSLRLHLDFNRPTSWFDSLERYIKETDVTSLDLSNMTLQTKDFSLILKILLNTQILELDLSGNCLKNRMEYITEPLIKTNIKKLNVSSCDLVENDVLKFMNILKDTQISYLDISKNDSTLYKDVHTFISSIVKSRLTALNLEKLALFGHNEEARFFIQELCNTSLMHLNLDSVFFTTHVNRNTLLLLFSSLKYTSITHLNLAGNRVGHCNLKNLCDSFRDSKLVELDLSRNELDDANVDTLFQAIKGTKITILKLASNGIKGDNSLGQVLTETQIVSLDLSHNEIICPKMFSFPDVLRGTSVAYLKLNNCNLSDDLGVELMKSLEFSKVTELDVSGNFLWKNSLFAFGQIVKCTNITKLNFMENMDLEAELISFGELLIGSKLQHLSISPITYFGFEPRCLCAFLTTIKNSSLKSLKILSYTFDDMAVRVISPFLKYSKLTHFDLSNHNIGGSGVQNLAAILAFTVITHLDLSKNEVNDEGAEALAGCLKKTCILDLNLSHNSITNRGAIALAFSLSGSKIVTLNLYSNPIESDGKEALAKQAESLILVVKVNGSPSVETVNWDNQRRAYKLNSVLSFFKRIAPETGHNSFQFEKAINNSGLDSFLEECLSFYRTALDLTSAVRFLAREESVSLSEDQISTLFFDEFPKQLVWFISTQVEAGLSEHVNFLRRVEELGLHSIVELLLLNRPVYMIDVSNSILHPFVYILLDKYKLPICNLDVEPQGIDRIIKYFTVFTDIEGAADVVELLQRIRL